MTELFLDIESAPNMEKEEFFAAKREIESGSLTKQSDPARYWKYSVGALNPYEGKAIFIAYRISSIGHIRRLKEWEDGEEAILKKLYDTIRTVKNGRLEFVGHNICGFDLPFLYGRMIHHKIDDPKKLYYNMQKTAAMDFLQMHLPLNDFHIKGLRHDALARAYGLPIKETKNSIIFSHVESLMGASAFYHFCIKRTVVRSFGFHVNWNLYHAFAVSTFAAKPAYFLPAISNASHTVHGISRL